MPDCSTELTSAVGRKKRRLFISIVTSAVGNIQPSVFQVVNKLSRLCRLLDEQVPGSAEFPDRQAAWSREGLLADEKFIEENGRKFFLLYLKPVINGVGNYYIEARTRGARM